MTTPRSREEIEKELQYQQPKGPVQVNETETLKAILGILNTNALNTELLLDIRDLLTKKNPTDL